MAALNINHTHKPIKDYYTSLKEYDQIDVPEKRYLAILTIYLLSHLVNHNGGGGGLGRLLPLWRIDKALDVGGVDVIFPVVKRCFEFPGLIQRRIVVSDLPRYWQAAFSVIRLPRIGRCLSDG